MPTVSSLVRGTVARSLLTLVLGAALVAGCGGVDPGGVDPGGVPGHVAPGTATPARVGEHATLRGVARVARDTAVPAPPPTLRVVTWNLESFPKRDATVGAVAAQIRALDADVIAIQEIDKGTGAFDALLAALPGYAGVLARPGWYTGVGLVYRKARVEALSAESLFVDDQYAFPRPALALRARVGTRPSLGAPMVDGGTAMTFVVVHLKAQSDTRSRARRRSACYKLDAWIDAHAGEEIVVLGDFNDRLTDTDSYNVFGAFLGDPAEYAFLTSALARSGAFSYPRFRAMIDHILVTDEVLAGRAAPSTSVWRLDLSVPSYEATISDHLPVVTTMTLR